jgi:hypothetical protein
LTDQSPAATDGISMENITPFIGFAAFPIAIGAAFIGVALTRDAKTIGVALIITAIFAVGAWALLRSQAAWRRDARMSNEALLALLVAAIGLMLLIGGLAALSIPFAVAGLAIVGGAWLIQRLSPGAR